MNVDGLEITTILLRQESFPMLITKGSKRSSIKVKKGQEISRTRQKQRGGERHILLTSCMIALLAIEYTEFLVFSSIRARYPASSNLGAVALALAARYSRSLTISSLRTRPDAKTRTGYRMEGKSKWGDEGGKFWRSHYIPPPVLNGPGGSGGWADRLTESSCGTDF